MYFTQSNKKLFKKMLYYNNKFNNKIKLLYFQILEKN